MSDEHQMKIKHFDNFIKVDWEYLLNLDKRYFNDGLYYKFDERAVYASNIILHCRFWGCNKFYTNHLKLLINARIRLGLLIQNIKIRMQL